MKIAVIYGVAHMSLGIFLKGTNFWHYGQVVDFLFEFLPQIVLMLALFGFMDYLIVLKWLTDFTQSTATAPSIITITIDMAMTYGEPSIPSWDPLIQPQAKQTKIMQIIMQTVLVCVPLMLCVKPIYLIFFKSHGHGKQIETEEEFVGGDYATSNNYLRASIVEQPEKMVTI